jgi:hypothetical protein
VQAKKACDKESDADDADDVKNIHGLLQMKWPPSIGPMSNAGKRSACRVSHSHKNL